MRPETVDANPVTCNGSERAASGDEQVFLQSLSPSRQSYRAAAKRIERCIRQPAAGCSPCLVYFGDRAGT